MKVKLSRHPREHIYRTICMVIGALIWASIIYFAKYYLLIPLVIIGIILWLTEKFFQAILFGNSVLVTTKQYATLNKIVESESKKLLGSKKPPLTFVVNSQGGTNALAIKFLSKKYVILYSSLVDLLWGEMKNDSLRMIVAHEIAHHAAGHTNFWLNLLTGPAMFIPYLGPAYSRSRELTADRIAADSVRNPKASMQALIALASGSEDLYRQTNVQAFIEQEKRVPFLFGFLLEIVATHPRITRRVIALMERNSRSSSNRNLSKKSGKKKVIRR